MQVGFGLADITPAAELPMAGMPGSPRGQGVEWPLRGRVLVADDGALRIAIVCLDLLGLPTNRVAELRNRLAERGSLDPGAILVACSHTHRAPWTFLVDAPDEEVVLAYLDSLNEPLVQAVSQAVAALQPAELIVGKVAAPGWAFNRRPIYSGGQVGTHGPAWGERFVGMEGSADNDLQVLLARALDGSVLGGLVGFACHPTVMAHEPVYSADYAGALSQALEARYGGTFGFLLGAAGDTSPPNPASPDRAHGHGRAHASAMGCALGDKAEERLRTGHVVAAEQIGMASTRLRIAQRRPSPEQVDLARWYLEQAPADLDEQAFTRRIYGHDYTFYGMPPRANERFARDMLGMWEWRRRLEARELVDEVELQVVAIGDVAFVAYPVELFTAFGRRLKASSPFPETFVATVANGWHGYVPTPEAFEHGGYEPRFAYSSRLVPEAGDMMTDAALELLRRVASRANRRNR
jgi:neutral ceramidase